MGVVKSLQRQGWKEWHILLAINNIRMNHIVRSLVPDDATDEQAQRIADSIRTRDEAESDPPPPLIKLDETSLKEALEASQLVTLTLMGRAEIKLCKRPWEEENRRTPWQSTRS
jgi:hypothetical protein